MKKQTLRNITSAAIALVATALLITGTAEILGLSRRFFSLLYIFVIMPGCLAMSDLPRRVFPEDYD